MSRVENGFVAFTAGEALEPYRRVKLGTNGRTVVYADAGDRGIGTTVGERITADDVTNEKKVTVRMDNAPGTVMVTVAGDYADKAVLYAAADGELSSTGTIPVAVLLDPDDKAEDGAAMECVIIGAGAAVDQVYHSHVVTSGEASANSGDGQYDFDTGFGAVPGFFIVQVRAATTGLDRHGFDALPLSGSDGTIRVNGNSGGTQVDEGDTIVIIARR